MFIVALVLFFGSAIAFGQEAPLLVAESSFAGIFKSWPEMGKLVAFVIAFQIFLRGVAEALTRVSDYTDNTWDNKVAAYCSEAAWFLGALLGKIGYGEPKLVTQEKVMQAAKTDAVKIGST